MQIQPNVAVVQAQHNPKVAIVYFEMCPKCVSYTSCFWEMYFIDELDLEWFRLVDWLTADWLARSFSFVILSVVHRPTGLSFTWRRPKSWDEGTEFTYIHLT